MALIKCKECGREISKSAKVCPNCGAKNKQTSFFTKITLGFIVLTVITGFFISNAVEKESKIQAEAVAQQKTNEKKKLAAMAPEQKAEFERLKKENALKAEESAKKAEGLLWNYSESEDKMGRGKIKSATVMSLNKIEFGFPYQSPQRAALQLRKHPEHGNDVILSIEKGQFICGIRSCSVQVKFGEGKAVKYPASGPADNSSTILFIGDFTNFVTNTKKSEKIYIEAQFFQEGNRVFEFETANLNW